MINKVLASNSCKKRLLNKELYDCPAYLKNTQRKKPSCGIEVDPTSDLLFAGDALMLKDVIDGLNAEYQVRRPVRVCREERRTTTKSKVIISKTGL